MTFRSLVAALAVSTCIMPLWAADSMNADAPSLTPGRYMASIMPGIDHGMAERLEDAVGKTDGIEKVKANYTDSSIHFTVKDGSKVPVTAIQKVIAKTDSDAVMSEPVLEHSLRPDPGL